MPGLFARCKKKQYFWKPKGQKTGKGILELLAKYAKGLQNEP